MFYAKTVIFHLDFHVILERNSPILKESYCSSETFRVLFYFIVAHGGRKRIDRHAHKLTLAVHVCTQIIATHFLMNAGVRNS